MKLNNKGFTLIELLAVVVILLIISVIAIPSISAAIERNKEKKNNAQINVIETYAEIYYETHKNAGASIEDFCINVNTLELTDAEKKDADGGYFEGSVKYENNGFKYQEKTCTKEWGENE